MTNTNVRLTWDLEVKTISEFFLEQSTIDVNPVGQRPTTVRKDIGENKASKSQDIIASILSNGDVGEVKVVKITDGRYQAECADGGHRMRAILGFLRNDFPTFRSSEFGEKYCRDLTDEQRKFFMNYRLRFIVYGNHGELSVADKADIFQKTNTTTPVNPQEFLNSFGDIPIANLIRETSRSVSGIDNDCHALFNMYYSASGNEIYRNVAFTNDRLKIDELVARLTYMIWCGEKPATASFDQLLEMYKYSFTKKEVASLDKKLKTLLDFVLKVSVQRSNLVGRGLLNKHLVILSRIYFYFKEKNGDFKVEDFSEFWSEFEKAYNAFNPQQPKRTELVENNRTIYEAFHGYLGDYTVQWKIDNSIKWFLEEFDLDNATVLILDKTRKFSREMVELKLAEQGYVDWVDGKPLTMKDAQGGHIIAHSKGGTSTYDNLVVISAEHNRRMQDINANDYKQMWIENQKVAEVA
jgi:hypothetical protein